MALLALNAGEQLDVGLPNLGKIGPELLKHLGGDPFALADEPEKDVLGADVVVPELEGFPERQLENLLGARGERNVSAGSLGALSNDLHDLESHRLEADAHALQGPGGDTLAFVDETEQDVLGADVVVVEQPRFFLGQNHDPACPVGEPLEQLATSYVTVAPSSRRLGEYRTGPS